MGKCTFAESTGIESEKPLSSGGLNSSDIRNALGALFQGDMGVLRPRAQSTPDMTIHVNPAALNSFFQQVWGTGNSPFTYAGGNTSAISAPSSLPRIDIVYLTAAGALAIVTGEEGVTPVADWASLPKDALPICLIYCKTTMTAILDYEDKDSDTDQGYIYSDVRPFLNLGGGASLADMYTAQDNIALLAFRLAVQGSLTVQKMEDGIVDEYEDETGVDTGASTANYDSSDDLYTNSVVEATGGTITRSGGKTIHTFLLADSGTNFVVPSGGLTVDVLIIGGGGAGGGKSNGGGGGGGGGFRYITGKALAAGNQAIVVGDGGAGVVGAAGNSGGASSAFGYSAAGGGGGGAAATAGIAGGSGGGGGGQSSGGAGDTPDVTPNQGTQGGNGDGVGYGGGGGGGATSAGGNGTGSGGVGGAGGNGTANSISGASVTYAGGGGGSHYNGTAGTGGAGGGGNGYRGTSGNGSPGTDNLGGGGGGGEGSSYKGGDGGSGIVIISYTTPSPQNLDLRSEAFTAEAVPVESRIVVFEEDVDSCAINTDIKAYVSRDGGTTYTQITLVDEGDYDTGKRILAGSVSLASQPSGTTMKYKIIGDNTKKMKIHGVSLSWKS